MKQPPLLLIVFMVLSMQAFGQGSCGSPDGTFFDDDDACSCIDLSCGGDCNSCFMTVCLDCPCLFPDDYADADADGNCLNDLAQGTYCFAFTQPTSGNIYTTLITNNCGGCNSLSAIGGSYDGSHNTTHPCSSETFDKDCSSLGSGLMVGTGNAGIAVGDIITYCVTVPAGCDGAMDICPVTRCDDEPDCGEATSALPITLVYIKTEREAEYVTLTWETASESNNDFFTIERRAEEMEEFDSLTTVKGMGNSNVTVKYTYQDNDPYPGKYIYRLSQTDYDGTSNYVGMGLVKAADQTGGLELIALFPVPASTELNYELHLPSDGFIKTEVLNAIGEQVVLTEEEGIEGTNGKSINVSGLPQGVYILKITTDDGMAVKQFVVSASDLY